METEHIKRPTNEIDKNRILSQASEAFDSMKKVLSELILLKLFIYLNKKKTFILNLIAS